MPLFGAHLSIAGGYHRALVAAAQYQCDTVQLFTKQPSNWAARPLGDEEVQRFHDKLVETGLQAPLAHDSYLINLASPDTRLWQRSLDAFVEEMQRAERLGLRYLVMHPGAHMGEGEEVGLARVARALDEVHARCPHHRVQILIETTAGQGTTLGYRFEHLARLFDLVSAAERLGVCFDTCHVFAAGYALAPEPAYRQTMRELDRLVGLDRVLAFHVNDSVRPQGSRVDRHAHLGQGQMGLEPFRLLVNDPRFRDRPMVLETPKENDQGLDMDAINLATLRGLLERRAA